jgi:ketosteroid isomerase-like protein
MRTARQLFDAFIANAAQPSIPMHTLFAGDGVYEVPYLESLGLPWRYRGRDEVAGFLDAYRDLFPQLAFHDVVIVAETADCVVAEYQFTTRSSRTARVVHQLIVGRLEAAAGEIALLRESVNLVEMALALFRYGLADPRAPTDREPVFPDPSDVDSDGG